MIEMRVLDDVGIYFMKCHIEKLDSLLNLVISKKITSDDAILLMWMASFAWKRPLKKRNHFKLSISYVANAFEISEQSVQRRLKRLKDANLIEAIYRYSSKGGLPQHYKKSKSTWKAKSEKGGRILHAFHKILDETFIVKTGKDEGQVFKETRPSEQLDDYDDDDYGI